MRKFRARLWLISVTFCQLMRSPIMDNYADILQRLNVAPRGNEITGATRSFSL
jgi:hypothetical protein